MTTEQYRHFSGDEAQELLAELLRRVGGHTDIYLVGSVALAVHLANIAMTPDIDAMFGNFNQVRKVARDIATERGLAPDWVNENVVPFIEFSPSVDDPDATVVVLGGVRVTVASKRALLAMKMAAYRQKDRPHITDLILDLGITDPDELVKLIRHFYPEGSMVVQEDDDELGLLAREAIRRAQVDAAKYGGPAAGQSK